MPNLQQAKKALRQSMVRATRNSLVREEIHSMRRRFRKLLEEGKKAEAAALMPTIHKMLDKSVTKRVNKLNTAARIKSRLAKRLASAK